MFNLDHRILSCSYIGHSYKIASESSSQSAATANPRSLLSGAEDWGKLLQEVVVISVVPAAAILRKF